MSFLGEAAKAAFTSSIFATLWSMGFSQKMCFPAAMASKESCAWRLVEAQMSTASIRSSSKIFL